MYDIVKEELKMIKKKQIIILRKISVMTIGRSTIIIVLEQQ